MNSLHPIQDSTKAKQFTTYYGNYVSLFVRKMQNDYHSIHLNVTSILPPELNNTSSVSAIKKNQSHLFFMAEKQVFNQSEFIATGLYFLRPHLQNQEKLKRIPSAILSVLRISNCNPTQIVNPTNKFPADFIIFSPPCCYLNLYHYSLVSDILSRCFSSVVIPLHFRDIPLKSASLPF